MGSWVSDMAVVQQPSEVELTEQEAAVATGLGVTAAAVDDVDGENPPASRR